MMTTVKQLAKDLCTTEENVIRWASEFHMNDERIVGDVVPRMLANYVKTRHLQETHPKIYETLSEVYDPSLAYERWVHAVKQKIKNGGE